MSDDSRLKEHTSLLNRISDQVAEQSKIIAKLDKKVDLNIQRIQYELEKIHQLDEQQNELIDQHIEGVNTLKRIHDNYVQEANSRFQTLEEPRKWMKTTKNILLVLGSLAGAAYVTLKLFSVI